MVSSPESTSGGSHASVRTMRCAYVYVVLMNRFQDIYGSCYLQTATLMEKLRGIKDVQTSLDDVIEYASIINKLKWLDVYHDQALNDMMLHKFGSSQVKTYGLRSTTTTKELVPAIEAAMVERCEIMMGEMRYAEAERGTDKSLTSRRERDMDRDRGNKSIPFRSERDTNRHRSRSSIMAPGRKWKMRTPTTHQQGFVTGDRYAFCGGSHPSRWCNVNGFDDIRKRKDWAMQQRRCFTCLTMDHVTRDCRTARPCAECGGNHNGYLCPKVCDLIAQRATGRDGRTEERSDTTVRRDNNHQDATVLLATMDPMVDIDSMAYLTLMDSYYRL
eukprot:GHVS01069926.1.p1 GENE.GHVS01069926.1~~GHVS01069926.1.p1  ORF type:complete len:330 (-),score=30.60 GHVS01069926.1:1061-2050(-)